MIETKGVDQRDLKEVLTRLKELRAWAVKSHCDPLAVRLALITVLALDAQGALDAGVTKEDLEAFDLSVWTYAVNWIKGRTGS